MNKKGISPLIATVLIIGFTVALAAVIITWGGQLVQRSIEDVEESKDVDVISGSVNINLKSADISTKKIMVENRGTADIEKLLVRGNGYTEEIDLATPLGSFGINSYDVQNGLIFSGGNVEIIPAADPDGDGISEFLGVSKDEVSVTRNYFRVFVTSTLHEGNFGGVSVAKQECNSLAAAAQLGGNWLVWMSNSSTSPLSSFYKSPIPYKLVNGILIADDWIDLTSLNVDGQTFISNKIHKDENGLELDVSIPSWGYIMTATDTGGNSVIENCNNWKTQDFTVQYRKGSISSKRAGWTFDTISTTDCNQEARFFCFEQPMPFE